MKWPNLKWPSLTPLISAGTSESGKTTIMKQMKILNKDGFSDA